MSAHVLTFDPSGNGHALYTELLDLSAIGPLEITRATTIEFTRHYSNGRSGTPQENFFFPCVPRRLPGREQQHFNR